jgi:hypothetical protein
MSVKEQALKEKLVDLDKEHEYLVSINREMPMRTENKVVSDIEHTAKELGWTMEEAWDYVNFIQGKF